MAQLTTTLFGTPQIEADNQPVAIGRRKAIALLAYLAVSGQPHSRQALTALLWPESEPARAAASLRSALWALNKTAVAPWLHVDADTAVLPPADNLTIDVIRFRNLLAVPQTHTHSAAELCPDCADSVAAAVTLYTGDFLAGFTLPDAPAFDEWHFFQASDLREQQAVALDRLLRYHSAAGNHDRAIEYGRRLAALDPLHEPAHRALMRLYAQAGQQAAALRQYELCREILQAELDITPSDETTALYEQIRTTPQSADRQSSIVNRQSSPDIPHNLPPEPTPLIGRGNVLQQIADFLHDANTCLITIVGPGGIGKTRLALAAARAALADGHFPDGVFFVPLAPVAEPEAMLSLIAETVGYPLQSDQRTSRQQLFDYFRQKSLLLVLDNFEHLRAGAAFVADLLQQAPQLTALATSRERLNLYEEQQFVLTGLDVATDETAVTDANYPAATLFLTSARRHRPDFSLTPADRPHLAAICRLVEGMPLGLELAAAWIEMLSLAEIAGEIQHNLDFLETAVRNVPERHRSMRAVFDGSWQRLTPTEQQVFARLSVFRGGFTAAAARAVGDAVIKELASLVNQSLLRTTPGSGRYDMHELLRQYGSEQLTTRMETDTYRRHAAYYSAFLQEREADMKGERQQLVMVEIEAELDNIAGAWRWASENGQFELLAPSLEALSLYYTWHGRIREWLALVQPAVRWVETAVSPDTVKFGIRLLIWHSVFDRAIANYDTAEKSLNQAKAILDNPTHAAMDLQSEKAFWLLQMSTIASIRTFNSETLSLNEQSLALYRSLGDEWGVAQALDMLGIRHQSLGNHHYAVELQRECLQIIEQQRDPRGIAKAYSSLGHYILFTGKLDESQRYLRKSLALFRELNLRAGQRHPLYIMGINQMFSGNFQASIDFSEACWAIHRELGMPDAPGAVGVGIVRSYINLGHYDKAQRLAETDLRHYRALKHHWYVAFTLFNLGRIALVAGDSSQAVSNLQEGVTILQGMNDGTLLPEVLFCLAIALRQQDDPAGAKQAIVRGLRIATKRLPLSPMRFELPAMALLCLDAGDIDQAIELNAASLQSRYIANSVWFETIVRQQIKKAAANLAPDVVAAAESRGENCDLLQLAKKLLATLTANGETDQEDADD